MIDMTDFNVCVHFTWNLFIDFKMITSRAALSNLSAEDMLSKIVFFVYKGRHLTMPPGPLNTQKNLGGFEFFPIETIWVNANGYAAVTNLNIVTNSCVT